jgi:plastocyanin
MRLQPFLNVVVLVSLVFSTVGPSAPAQAAGGGDATHAGDDSPRPGPVPTGAEAGSDALEANQILITETGFSPDVLTVTVGSQVTWLNTTGQTHVLVSGQPERIYLPIILKQAGQAAASGSGANEPPPQAGLTADEDFRVSIPPGETFAHTFTSAGVHNYSLATAPQFTGQVICQAGPGSLTVTLSAQPASGVVPLSVDLAATVSNVAGGVLTYTWEYGDSITDTMPATTSLEVTASHFYPLVGSYPVTVTVSDAEASASAQQTITVTPHSVALPPDPADVAPDLDRTVATTMVAATEFLYAGDPPIQTGVAPGAIDPQRVAVLRGRVLDREDTPLSGVTISILNRPEFGQTLSQAGVPDRLAPTGRALAGLRLGARRDPHPGRLPGDQNRPDLIDRGFCGGPGQPHRRRRRHAAGHAARAGGCRGRAGAARRQHPTP